MGAPCCAGAAAAGSGGGSGSWVELAMALPHLAEWAWTTSPKLTLLVVSPVVLLLLMAWPALLLLSPKDKPRYFSKQEQLYFTPPALALPTLAESASVQLSVVVPAYNERQRLPGMLREAVTYLESVRQRGISLAEAAEELEGAGVAVHKGSEESEAGAGRPSRALVGGGKAASAGAGKAAKARKSVTLVDSLDPSAPLNSYEILVVDDGSRDGTAEVARDLARELGLEGRNARSRDDEEEGERSLRVARLLINRGKGGAVRHGILHSRGANILFADADGATKFSELSKLARELERIRTPAGHGIVVGSRAHMVGSEAVVKRSFIRNFLMHSFHLLLSLLLRPPNPFAALPSLPSLPLLSSSSSRAARRRRLAVQAPIQDTQCGFKMLTRQTARAVLPLCHIDGWIFDVEILLLAEMAGRSAQLADPEGVEIERRKAAEASSSPPGEKGDVATAVVNGSAGPTCSLSSSRLDEGGAEDPLLRLALPISELAVAWTEVQGSKIDLVRDSIRMALDLVVIRANYATGRWRAPKAVQVRRKGGVK